MNADRPGRALLRLVVAVAVAAGALSGGPVLSQPASSLQLPHLQQTVTVPVGTDPPPPAGRGLATTGSGAQAQSSANLPAANVVTHGCAGGSRSESRLGLMKDTAMYSHCDYP